MFGGAFWNYTGCVFLCEAAVRCLAGLVITASLTASIAHSQVVRGAVTDRVSGQPLRGVLVSIASATDSMGPAGVRHVLSDTHGEFAVSLSSPGDYVLTAKRIGVTRHITPVFSVRSGETRRIEIALEPFMSRLPEMRVTATNLCLARQEQLGPIVALWEEARTALQASEVTRKAALLTGWLSQYTRSLDPRSLRILEEQRTVTEGRFDRPMRSLSGDSLAKTGYWRRIHADTMVFYGPDAEALLSAAFQSGHCFELEQGTGARRGMIGIAFRPRRSTPMGGIDGTIWVDASTFELRFVEFRYTNLITLPRNPHLGGQVHFLRHESGAWLVSRWFLRMPVFPSVLAAADVAARGGDVRTTPRPTVYRIIEEGGVLFTPGLFTWEVMGTITGRLVDSTGRQPLKGAVVSLSGTPYSVGPDSSDSFRFDSIPPGPYTLLVSHPDYAALGQLADDEPLMLESGQTYRANLRAIATKDLLKTLCGDREIHTSLATVRVFVTDAETGAALNRFPLWLRWLDPDQNRTPRTDSAGSEDRFVGVQTATDPAGSATFCGVPAGRELELLMLRPGDDPAAGATRATSLTRFSLQRGTVVPHAVTARPPR